MPNYVVESVDGRLSVRCTLTEESVRKDFASLCGMPRAQMAKADVTWEVARAKGSSDPPPVEQKLPMRLCKPHSGQWLAEYCHWKSRFHTPTDKNPSAFDLLARKTTTVDWLEDCYVKSSGCTSTVVSQGDGDQLFEALRRRSSLESVTHFRASAAKFFCDECKVEKVLDVCAGWGDRLSGFLSSESVKHVVLIDPRQKAHPKYQQQVKIAAGVREERGWSSVDVRSFAEPAQGNSCSAEKGPLCRLIETEAGTFDLCMTSPPYFSKELYGRGENDIDGQCWVTSCSHEDLVDVHVNQREIEYQAWREDFLDPVLDSQIRLLRLGGHLILNLDDVDGLQICDFVLHQLSKRADLMFVGTAGLQKTGRCEPVYIWRKTRATFKTALPLNTSFSTTTLDYLNTQNSKPSRVPGTADYVTGVRMYDVVDELLVAQWGKS